MHRTRLLLLSSLLVWFSGCEIEVENTYSPIDKKGTTVDSNTADTRSDSSQQKDPDGQPHVNCAEKQNPEEWQCTEEWDKYEDPELVERGEYLVRYAAFCQDCHTPRNLDARPGAGNYVGKYKMEQFMSGRDCLWDFAPRDDSIGCIHSRNLTPHPTGLGKWSPKEVRKAFTEGLRLHQEENQVMMPFMPYRNFYHMKERDQDAVLAFLHTAVEPVEKETPKRQQIPGAFGYTNRPDLKPLDVDGDGKKEGIGPLPEEPYPDIQLPESHPDYDDAKHGKYLSMALGCEQCHTPRYDPPQNREELFSDYTVIETDKILQGGREFPSRVVKIDPSKGYPNPVKSANLTPHKTGIKEYSIQELVLAIKDGVDRENQRMCPPMPAGQNSPFGGLKEEDLEDIALFLKNIPPVKNKVDNCKPPQ